MAGQRTLAGIAAGAASGLACYLAFPPSDLGLLAFVAIVPLAIYFATSSARQVALASATFGLVFFGVLLYWIRLFGNLAYVALTIVQTLWVVASMVLARVLRNRLQPGWKFLALPLGYMIGEFARTHLPWGGFAWGGLGYTQHENPIALHLAPYGGVWAISFVVLVVNSLLAEAITGSHRPAGYWGKRLAGVAALLVLPVVLPVGSPTGDETRIAMVQGSVPENTADPSADDETVLENHVELTRKLQGEDVSMVVWAEGAFDSDPFRNEHFLQALTSSVKQVGAPFLVGAILGTRESGLRNSTLMMNPDGTLERIYTKQRLVPFGEFVPLRRFLEPWVKELARVPNDLRAGHAPTVFDLPGGKVASVICYESTYPDLVRAFVLRGARLLVVSTNFSSYERSAAADQHIAFSQLRAAEHRMWVAHTAISGKSAVIAPDGKVVASTPLFTQAILTPTVRYAETTTLYARLGDWVPYGSMMLALFLLVVGPASQRLLRRLQVPGSSPEEAEAPTLTPVPSEGEQDQEPATASSNSSDEPAEPADPDLGPPTLVSVPSDSTAQPSGSGDGNPEPAPDRPSLRLVKDDPEEE